MDGHTPASGFERLKRPWLVADIGGTNARFGWLSEHSARAEKVRTLPAAEHADPAAAARAYLDDLRLELGDEYVAPHAAAFAVATAVTGDRISFTNSGWAFSREATRQALGLEALLLLNDFEALALSLPGLVPAQRVPLGLPAAASPAPSFAHAALAVVGPGTGLGVAGLLPHNQGWIAVPGEGGHATLSASDDFESALLAAVRLDFDHVSAERLLSGIGLPVLHAAVSRVLDSPHTALSSGEIVERGLAGTDAVCSRTIDSFCALLGSFSGNVALVLGARGGVYIGGGIVPRLGDRFLQSQFRARFEAKGRFGQYLKAIPTWLITDTLAALGGAAFALEQHRP